jgi:hypothetical protein
MNRITLAALKRVNQASIQHAGPRYTPSIDPNAPNLEIRPLVNAIEALAHSTAYRQRLQELGARLRSAWKKAPAEIRSLFSKSVAASELCAALIEQLRKEKPGLSSVTLRQIRRALRTVQARLEPYAEELYRQRTNVDPTQTRESVASRIYELQQFQRVVGELRGFIDSPDFALVRLLSDLNRLGKRAGGRALLVIDGINEGDRMAWRRYMASLIASVRKFHNVALVLSCRTPFENQILTARSRRELTQAVHTGFQDIEFDAQRKFFRYYKIPTPHIPLLAPEFSKPLFLKTLCQTISSLSKSVKQTRIRNFASGQKGMAKLLEDFVVKAGKSIEADFSLPSKSCWLLLKGQGDGTDSVGIAVEMADRGRDYVFRSECLEIIRRVIGLDDLNDAESFLSRLVSDGLLTEDSILEEGAWSDVVRLPYQRFSDHLISRHLLARYLKTDSEVAIQRSFYTNRPLGKIFKVAPWGWQYEMPGLASAVMLEFPERVKRALPADKRELVFYLPQASRAVALMGAFVEGLLWRSSDSFSAQTDCVTSQLLNCGYHNIQDEMLEALVCLASRTGHPYSAERLYKYLSSKSLIERDIFWSEFLRSRSASSAVYRVLDWIIATEKEAIREETAANLIWLCALFLTSTVRTLRDRATRCLVLLGEQHPQVLLSATAASFSFNDPYVPERMLAASYGVLMRKWAFPPPVLAACAVRLATELRTRLKGSKTVAPIEHILMRDYAEGIVALAQKLSQSSKSPLSLDGLRVSRKSVIPSGDSIPEESVEEASAAIHMDFDNYTMGRLVENRSNYDFDHKDYRRVRRQIRWRILNLGYRPERFKAIDSNIGSSNFHMGRSDGGKKVDRYGKKYSWIAYFEVAGRRRIVGTLPDRDDIRVSDTDIDPSFPAHVLEWRPPLASLFKTPYRGPASWMRAGSSPEYSPILICDEVDGLVGPWVLLQGFVSERSPKDPREVFTFLRGLLIAPADLSRLDDLLHATEYPGNHAIPDPGTDYYLFAGEIGWSRKFGSRLRGSNGRAKPQLDEVLERYESRVVEKRYAELTPAERLSLVTPTFTIVFGGESVDKAKEEPIPKSRLVRLQRSVCIPGVKVELPYWGFSWESYHSEENQGASADYPAPSLVDYLRLRKVGGAIDLVEESKRVGMVYRKFGDYPDGFRSHLLYLRADLLTKYLARTGRLLVWINWGERTLHHSVSEQVRGKPAVQAVWESHEHIHKALLVYRDGHARPTELIRPAA